MSASLRRRTILYVANILLELFWIGGLLQVITPLGMTTLSPTWLIAATILLMTTNRFLSEVAGLDDHLRPRLALLVSVGIILLLTQLGLLSQLGWFTPARLFGLLDGLWTEQFQPGLLLLYTLFGLGLLWYRLLDIDGQGLGIRATTMRFQVSLILLAGIAVLGATGRSSLPPWLLVADVIVGLLAISLARAESVATTYGQELPFTRRTAGLLLAAIGTTAIAALLLGLLTGVVGSALFTPFLRLLDLILLLLTSAIVFVLQPLLWLFQAIRNWLQGEPGSDAELQPPLAQTDWRQFLSEAGPVTPAVQAWRLVLLVCILVGFAYLVARTLQRRWQVSATATSGRESVYTSGQLGQDLSALLRGSLDALNAIATGMRRRFPNHYGIENVHDLYKNLLQLGARVGTPRAPQMTPAEYLPLLTQQLPENVADLTALTEAYSAAHYGGRHFSETEIQALQAVWQRLATAAQPLEAEMAAADLSTE